MRCAAARLRLPDRRAERHAATCSACHLWRARVDRARLLVSATTPPAPARLSTDVLTAVRMTLPTRAPSPPRRRTGRGWRAATAAAAAVTVVAAALIVVARRPEQALAAAAAETRLAETARFRFQGEFGVLLHAPEGFIERIRNGVRDGLDGLSRSLLDDLPAGVRDALDQELEATGELVADRVADGIGLVGELAPELRLRLEGTGAFDRGRVQLDGTLTLLAPDREIERFSFVRIRRSLYLRGDDGDWVRASRIPADALRPVAHGLDQLTTWIEDGAEGADPAGRETLDGVSTTRYRLALPARVPGVVNGAEVWVGEQDGYVRRVLVSRRAERELVTVSGRMDVRLSAHGKAVRIAAPEASLTIEAPSLFGPAGRHLREMEGWLGAGLPGPGGV